MVQDSIPGSGAMEGDGAYNRHSRIPAGGVVFALAPLEAAARRAILEHDDRPVVIADYGSSEGKNSLVPMRIIIETFRSQLGAQRPIVVCHTDLPANDFKSLFELLENDPDRYTKDDPNVFPCVIGRSFYQALFPPDRVDLGWCSYAAMWISQIPSVLPDHIFVPRMTGRARVAFERHAAQDWETFLSLRGSELRPGGRLVVVVPGAGDEGNSGYEAIMDHAYAVLSDMVADGAVSTDERARMALGVWPRRRRDLLAPFHNDGRYRNLTVEYCETSELPDPAWVDYERDGDKEALVDKHAGFYRSIFAPSLASWLTRAGDAEARRNFSEQLESRLKRRLMVDPAPINSLVETLVFAKPRSA
jgi:SAM dependent carboxyl methyltransferase